MDNILLQTWTDKDDADVMYSYQIVKETESLQDDDGEYYEEDIYVIYRELGPLRYKKCGKYERFLEAVKGLEIAMKNEIYEEC